MLVQHSTGATAAAHDPAIQRATDAVSKSFLRETVERLSIPRHADLEPDNNRLTAHWVASQLRSYGYETDFQGEFANVIARPKQCRDTPWIIVGAHYDSVPGCPGADDNASAVAAMLACAKALAAYAPARPVWFASFNREEDGMLCSADFVKDLVERQRVAFREAHILEMVGYCDPHPGSQSLPQGLPIRVPDRGDFLGIVANKGSTALADSILEAAKTYRPDFPVLSLKVYVGIEQLLPVLLRSDHAPFWKAGIPAVMWTDTSEFRNHHYHQATDTPQTLDYDFLRAVTQVLIATVSTTV
jgi:Zn-dependent M28 family amino/carboxypeptidase